MKNLADNMKKPVLKHHCKAAPEPGLLLRDVKAAEPGLLLRDFKAAEPGLL